MNKLLLVALMFFSCNIQQEKQTELYRVKNLYTNKIDILEYRKGFNINDTIYKIQIYRYLIDSQKCVILNNVELLKN